MTSRFALACVAALAAAATSPAQTITLGQVDDFQDGTTQGWSIGRVNPAIPPANVGGELQLATNGNTSGQGHRLIAFNNDQWTGDYLAAGVDGLLLDIDNSDNAVDLNIRLGISGPGGTFVTNDVLAPALTSLDGVLFTLTDDNLFDVNSGGGDLAATLAGVTELRLLHNPDDPAANAGRAQGEPVGDPPIAATVRFDNLTAVAIPEPTAAALLVLGGLAASATRGRRRRV